MIAEIEQDIIDSAQDIIFQIAQDILDGTYHLYQMISKTIQDILNDSQYPKWNGISYTANDI